MKMHKHAHVCLHLCKYVCFPTDVCCCCCWQASNHNVDVFVTDWLSEQLSVKVVWCYFCNPALSLSILVKGKLGLGGGGRGLPFYHPDCTCPPCAQHARIVNTSLNEVGLSVNLQLVSVIFETTLAICWEKNLYALTPITCYNVMVHV